MPLVSSFQLFGVRIDEMAIIYILQYMRMYVHKYVVYVLYCHTCSAFFRLRAKVKGLFQQAEATWQLHHCCSRVEELYVI